MNLRRLLFVIILQVLGVLIIVSFAYNNFKSDQLKAASHVKDEVNSIIYLMESYYNSELTHVIDNESCKEKLESLNDFMLLTPPLKSINISNPDFIFCSTFFQTRNVETPDWFITDHQTRFIFSNYIPTNTRISLGDRKVFLLQFRTNDKVTAVFYIYAQVIYKLLHFSENEYFDLYLKVSNGTFSSEGPAVFEHGQYTMSSEGLFKVYYHSSIRRFIRYALKNYDGIIFFWIITTIFSSHFLYDFLFVFNKKTRLIKKGLKNSEFYPYLQPVFNREGKLIGAEVLVRWINDKGDIISPSEFINEAERNGLIKQIMSQLADKCIHSLSEIIIPDDSKFTLAFNTCPIQFEDGQLFNDINKLSLAFKHHNISIAIEITERQEFASNELYIASIDRLKEMNVRISLDDFGTGHCSLKYLHQVDIDVLKIDKSYIQPIGTGNNNDVLENIIDLARRLNVPLVAEGIENQTQYEFLLNKGIQYYQGFLLGNPMPINEFIERYFS